MYQKVSQQTQTDSNDQQMTPQHEENKEKKKKPIIIKDGQSFFAFSKQMLSDFLNSFESFQQQLNKIENIQKDEVYQCIQLMDQIIDLLSKTKEKIHSLENRFSQQQHEGQTQNRSDQEFQKQRKVPYEQISQLQGDQESSSLIYSEDTQQKQQTEIRENKIQQKNEIPNNQIQCKGCIINHSYPYKNLQDYQLLLQRQLESNLKIKQNKEKSLLCYCEENIKQSDLTTLFNKNLFNLLLNQQLQNLFQFIPQKKVLNCTNNFCNFRCIQTIKEDNLDKRQYKFYCPACDENSVE